MHKRYMRTLLTAILIVMFDYALFAETNDRALLINIHNFEKFYEYHFNLANKSMHEMHKGDAFRTKGKGEGDYVTHSEDFNRKYILRKQTMNNAIKKYKDVFSLFDTALIQISPDKHFILYIKNVYDTIFTIIESKDHRVVTEKKTRKINDALWINENNSIALLTVSSKFGYRFSDLISALAGHPVQYNTFYLEIYSLNGQKQYEAMILSNIKNGTGSLISEGDFDQLNP